MRLLLAREPLDAERIARLEPAERRGAEAVRAALATGDALGLAPSGSYRSLVDRGGAPIVTVVVGAPVDRIEPIRWWFPIVGSVPYRGYFEPERARAFAASLAEDGHDSYVRPALLYSTLGWFDDPVPRALLALDPLLVQDTLVHERVHETVFLADDVAYNEGLATFVAHQALLRELTQNPEQLARAQQLFADERRFGAWIERLAAELESLYARVSSPQEARREREAVFARFRGPELAAAGFETDRFGGLASVELSNAFVVAQRTYLAELPCFERELEALGGDLVAFVARHREAPGRHVDGCAP
jgi:predicted aminopeptidase